MKHHEAPLQLKYIKRPGWNSYPVYCESEDFLEIIQSAMDEYSGAEEMIKRLEYMLEHLKKKKETK